MSGGANSYCLSGMSKTRSRNRHSTVKARVYFINHSVNGCMVENSSCVHATLYIVHVYDIANFCEKISFLRE